MELCLKVQNLTLKIGNKTLIPSASFSCDGPGFYSIQGENGSGKTTLLKEIFQKTNKTPSIQLFPQSSVVQYLSHELGLYSSLSVQENLDYFASLSPNPQSKLWLENALLQFGLKKKRNEPVFTLSRGQKQKVALLRTFVMKPDLVLLDEPFTGLDSKSLEDWQSWLNEIQKECLILSVLHEKFPVLQKKGSLYLKGREVSLVV